MNSVKVKQGDFQLSLLILAKRLSLQILSICINPSIISAALYLNDVAGGLLEFIPLFISRLQLSPFTLS